MSRPYRISEKAIEDLENIWIYSSKTWSAEQADRYYKLIVDEIEHLTEYFESGKDISHIEPGYRSSKVKSHLIFYVKDENGVLEVKRIYISRWISQTGLNKAPAHYSSS